MAGLPWFKFFAQDFLADGRVMAWSLEERGAFISLLAHCWSDGSIPGDQTSLGRLLHVEPSAMRGLWSAIGDRFIPHPDFPGRLTSPRLEMQREEAEKVSQKRSEAGTKAATSRWAKEKARHSKRTANASGPHADGRVVASVCHTDPDVDPDQEPKAEGDSETDSLWLAGIAKRVADALGQGRIGLGDRTRRQDVKRAISRVVAMTGEDIAVQSLAQIARQHLGGQVSALTAFPGWLDRIPDSEWRRVGGIQ